MAWVLSSVVAFIPVWRTVIAKRLWLFRLIALGIGLPGFYIDDIGMRIGAIGLGSLETWSFSFLAIWIDYQAIFSSLLGSTSERRNRAAYGFILGLVVMVIVQMGFYSINATFYYPIANFVAIVGALLSVLIHYNEVRYFSFLI